MNRTVFIFILLFGIYNSSYTQQTIFDETTVLYKYEFSGGAILHTNGFGANIRKSKFVTGFKKRFWQIEMVGMKHPKEYKTYNQYYEDTKGYVFGKLNSLTILRPGIGKLKVIYSKETKKGVEISYLYSGGAAIGFVKPIYLEIGESSFPYTKITTEKYNENKHTISNIYGKAPAMKGIEETKIYPGIYAKFGLNFEYAPLDDRIKALETGITIDLFYKEVPIMAFIENKQMFFSFYINLIWGKKSY